MSKDFAIQFSLSGPQGTTSIAQAATPRDADEFFERIRRGAVAWRAGAGGAMPSLQVFVAIRRREAQLPEIVHALCARWNADPALAALPAFRFEMSIGTNAESWIGCSNCDNLHDMRSLPREMRFRDYAVYLAELEAAAQALDDAEGERRRANPVRDPAALPDDIADEIARYLRLEFGEQEGEPGSLRTQDLVLEGEFVVDGVPTLYWRFPVSAGAAPMWATVERFEDGYCLGMTGDAPPSRSRAKAE